MARALPIGSRRGGVELVDEPRKPPAAPRSLDRRSKALWRELFSEPVSELWGDGDGRLVTRLVGLLVRIERDGADAPGWVFALCQGIEDRLYLNPRARRAAGIVLVPPPASSRSREKVGRLDDRRRARLAKGV